MSQPWFYSRLTPLELPVAEVLHDKNFHSFPSGWHVIISDIKNSTEAVRAGRHNDVNLVAAGSLIAALNIARRHALEIPYYFGGDGGTLLVPGQLLADVLSALAVHNRNSRQNFDMEMHLGSISVDEITAAGHSLRIAKMRLSDGLVKPVIVGDGLQYAELLIKEDRQNALSGPNDSVDLTGLECRWNRVKPPVEQNEVVCFLMEATHTIEQLKIYREVLEKIDEIYGNIQKRHPLSPSRMKLQPTLKKLRNEILVKYGRSKPARLATSVFQTIIGSLLFRYNWIMREFRPREYMRQVIANTDTINIDGRLTTVVTGEKKQRLAMLAFLQDKEATGELVFGHHASAESVITCYIEDRDKKHIHFLDGADGGYTEAAREFKKKKMQPVQV